MIQEYILTPPPDEIWFIVYESDMSTEPRYGSLTSTENTLGYDYDTIERFTDKESWIERLLELGIDYMEEIEE